MIRKIPPNIFWPGLIIALLSLSIIGSFTGLYFAQSDGGPQIVPDYYEKSVEYDETYDARRKALELGWQVDAELQDDRGRMTVGDDEGQPVDGLEGTLTYHRPDLAEPIATVELEATGEPGQYHFDDITDRPGYWDLVVEIWRGDEVYVDSIRISVDR